MNNIYYAVNVYHFNQPRKGSARRMLTILLSNHDNKLEQPWCSEQSSHLFVQASNAYSPCSSLSPICFRRQADGNQVSA